MERRRLGKTGWQKPAEGFQGSGEGEGISQAVHRGSQSPFAMRHTSLAVNKHTMG